MSFFVAILPMPVQRLLLVLASGLSYWLAYRLNTFTDAWSVYDQGINLIFLPAGVKHLAILLARGWGALGCGLALLAVSFEFWHNAHPLQLEAYSTISTLASWMGVVLGLRLLQVRSDLNNLRFWHLPVMDLVTTGLHAVMVNGFFFLASMKSDNWISNVLAVMLGDYLGSFITLICLWAVIVLMNRLRRMHGTGSSP
ncbi:MAG: hypothetical protein RIQ97_775 [Pseudomonadota bacterium]|jgi:hypothetical protein